MIYLLATNDITAVAIVFPEQCLRHKLPRLARMSSGINSWSGSSDLDWIDRAGGSAQATQAMA